MATELETEMQTLLGEFDDIGLSIIADDEYKIDQNKIDTAILELTNADARKHALITLIMTEATAHAVHQGSVLGWLAPLRRGQLVSDAGDATRRHTALGKYAGLRLRPGFAPEPLEPPPELGGGGHHKKRRRKSKRRKSKRRSTRRKSTRRKTKKRKSKGRKSRRRRR